ncbi:inner membrane-spanning protein YciB [Pleionea sediminis]|uniref:inner membrane-spanning protein YciB n=1 Tax=Pleionea sediminis TaxID=2569479 RepID=UPI001184A4FF|nr:inner membrane-spanning protein YciB [Pleionea sediminis]
MKFLLDFFPLLGFFVAFKTYDIYVATVLLMALVIIQMIVTWLLYRKIEKIHVISSLLAISAGAFTLFFQNPDFLKWKVSVICWILSGAIWFRLFLLKKLTLAPLFQAFSGGLNSVPDRLWSTMDHIWALYYTGISVLNFHIAYTMSLDTWVDFKVWGLLIGQTALLMLSMIPLIPYFRKASTASEE